MQLKVSQLPRPFYAPFTHLLAFFLLTNLNHLIRTFRFIASQFFSEQNAQILFTIKNKVYPLVVKNRFLRKTRLLFLWNFAPSRSAFFRYNKFTRNYRFNAFFSAAPLYFKKVSAKIRMAAPVRPKAHIVSPAISPLFSPLHAKSFRLVGKLISPYSWLAKNKDYNLYYNFLDLSIKSYNRKKIFFKEYFAKKFQNQRNAPEGAKLEHVGLPAIKTFPNFFAKQPNFFLQKHFFFRNFFFFKKMAPDLSYFLFHFYFLKLLPRNELHTKVKNKPYSFFFNKQMGRFSTFKLKTLIGAFRFYKKFYKFFKLADPSVRKKKIFLQAIPNDFSVLGKNTLSPSDSPNYQTPLRTFSKVFANAPILPYWSNLQTSGALRSRKLIARSYFKTFLTRTLLISRNSLIRRKFNPFGARALTTPKLKQRFVALVFLQLIARRRLNDAGLRCRTTPRMRLRSIFYYLASTRAGADALGSVNASFRQTTAAPTKSLLTRNASSTYWAKFRQFRFFYVNRLNLAQMRFWSSKPNAYRIKFRKNKNLKSNFFLFFTAKRGIYKYALRALMRKPTKTPTKAILTQPTRLSTARNKHFMRSNNPSLSELEFAKPRKAAFSRFGPFTRPRPQNVFRGFRPLKLALILLNNRTKRSLLDPKNTLTATTPLRQRAPAFLAFDGLSSRFYAKTSKIVWCFEPANFSLNANKRFFAFSDDVSSNLTFPNFPLLAEKGALLESIDVFSRTQMPFLGGISTHLLRTFSNPLRSLSPNISHLIKKKNYSFSHKNEMENYVLKRYFKNKSVASFEYFLTNKKENIFSSSPTKSPEEQQFFRGVRTPSLLAKAPALFAFLPAVPSSQTYTEDYDFLKTFIFDTSDQPVKRVKFKPGYSTIWRTARKLLQTELNLNFRYQRKLTRFIVKFYKFSRLNFFLFAELKFQNIIEKAKLLSDANLSKLFIENGLFYLNGYNVFNPSLTVVLGDFVQLIVHIKYYIMHKWLLHAFLQLRLRLRNKIHTKMTKKKIIFEDKQKSQLLPKWILNHKVSFYDVPNYLEVDYLTLSFLLIYEPFSWNDLDPYYYVNFRPHAMNMYNWKYIT